MTSMQKGALAGMCLLLVLGAAEAQQAGGVASPDGKLRVKADGKVVSVLDAASGKEMCRLLGHTDIVQAVAISPDGKLIASGGNDLTICLWDLASGKLRARIRVNSAVLGLNYSKDGKQLTSRLADNTSPRFDPLTGKQLSE